MLKSDLAALLTGLMLAAGVMVTGFALEDAFAHDKPVTSRSRYLLDTRFGQVECDQLRVAMCGLHASQCNDLRTYSCLTDVRYEERP